MERQPAARQSLADMREPPIRLDRLGSRVVLNVAHEIWSLRMKLLWYGEWIETPGYEAPDGSVLIDVSGAVPLVTLKNASGRRQRRPGRKVAVFLVTDGPRSTSRKAKTKLEEPRFTGDLRVCVVLGEVVGTGRRVVALAPRVAACAQQVVVHPSLVLGVADSFSLTDLQGLAARLAANAEALNRLGRQSFLYSGLEPPADFTALLASTFQAGDADSPAGSPQVLRPPKGNGKAADTVLRLKSAPAGSGLPVAVLGGGDHTRSEIIPGLRRANLTLYAVANREPQIAALVGEQFGFALAATDSERAIAELPAPGLVVVATAHDSHTQLACSALKAGHRVFVEKPPAVTPEDVQRLADAMRAHPGAVEVGFNRRYHPLVRKVRPTAATGVGSDHDLLRGQSTELRARPLVFLAQSRHPNHRNPLSLDRPCRLSNRGQAPAGVPEHVGSCSRLRARQRF
jgi:hypothetical protein